MAGNDGAGDSIEIRPLLADDAERLTACFERCYGVLPASTVRPRAETPVSR